MASSSTTRSAAIASYAKKCSVMNARQPVQGCQAFGTHGTELEAQAAAMKAWAAAFGAESVMGPAEALAAERAQVLHC